MANQLSQDKEKVSYAEKVTVVDEIGDYCKEKSKELGREFTQAEFFKTIVKREINTRRRTKGLKPLQYETADPNTGRSAKQRAA
jgi:hypothetical protein